MALNEKGQEVPDPTPVEVPLRFRDKHVSLHEKIAAYVRSEQFKQKMAEEGLETEDEANDFEIEGEEDGDLPLSPSEAAVLMAEELEVRKKEILDIEGKMRYNKNQEVRNGRTSEAEKVGSVGQAREADSAVGESEPGAVEADRGGKKRVAGTERST